MMSRRVVAVVLQARRWKSSTNTAASIDRDRLDQVGTVPRPRREFYEDVMSSGVDSGAPTPVLDRVLKDGTGFRTGKGKVVHGAVLCVQDKIFQWQPSIASFQNSVLELAPDSLGLLAVLSNKPELLIIGSGSKGSMIGKETRAYLQSIGVQVESMDTKSAAATYNVLTQEGRSVAAALFAPSSLLLK